jgi:hypothetical protein
VRFSKPFTPLLGSYKEFLIEDVWRGRPLCDKGEFEVVDDPVHHGTIFDESDDAHLALALGASEWVHFIDFTGSSLPSFWKVQLYNFLQ